VNIQQYKKRAYVFFDGQNLFHAAKDAFGYPHVNYDPKKLSEKICEEKGWQLDSIYFYTGIPSPLHNEKLYKIWTAKLAVMGTRGIKIFSRELRYTEKKTISPDGSLKSEYLGREKGIDVRIALDIVRFAFEDMYDVAVIFSQDQDFIEAVKDVKTYSKKNGKWIELYSAFPFSKDSVNSRGIYSTDWIKIDKDFYDSCIDPINYLNG